MAEKAKRKANGRAKAGHNKTGDVPDELIERWWLKVEAAQAAVEKAKKPLASRKGELRALYKAAGADGVDAEALREAIDMHNTDHLEVAEKFSNTGRYLRAHKSALGVQLQLFSVDNVPDEIKAAVAGKRAGRRGDSIDINPFTPGTDAFQAFREHWDLGQQEIRDTM